MQKCLPRAAGGAARQLHGVRSAPELVRLARFECGLELGIVPEVRRFSAAGHTLAGVWQPPQGR